MNFYSSISGSESYSLPNPWWQATENYLHLDLGQTNYVITRLHDRHVELQETTTKASPLLTVLKVISYATLVLPGISLILRAYYRSRHTFEIISREPVHQPDRSWNQPTPSPRMQAPETPMHMTAYNVDAVIARIKQAKEEGYKVALFAGRRNDQILPSSNEEKWFSLDLDIAPQSPSDNHLQMDLNSEDLEKIWNLFNKVVLDYSVIKFLHFPWIRLSRLLVREEESELITELYGTLGYTSDYDADYRPREGTIAIPIREQNRYQASKNEAQASGNSAQLDSLTDPKDTYLPIFIDKIRTHLQRLFDEVNLVEASVYPYRAQNEEIVTRYWKLCKPKI